MNSQGFQTVSRRGRSMITSSTISSSSRRAWRTEAVRRYSKNIITSCNANAASLIRQSQHSNSKSMSSIVSPTVQQSIRWKSSSSSSESTVTSTKAKDGMDKVVKVPKPTNVQLRNHFIAHAIPMVSVFSTKIPGVPYLCIVVSSTTCHDVYPFCFQKC